MQSLWFIQIFIVIIANIHFFELTSAYNLFFEHYPHQSIYQFVEFIYSIFLNFRINDNYLFALFVFIKPCEVIDVGDREDHLIQCLSDNLLMFFHKLYHFVTGVRMP